MSSNLFSRSIVVCALSGIAFTGCAADVGRGHVGDDASAWLPEDGKADSNTLRELSTASFVGYLRGCEATYSTATENEIELSVDASREWWLLECYGRANNWAAPLLQSRVDSLAQTDVKRPVVEIFDSHRAALRNLCETNAAIVPEATQGEYLFFCYGAVERDIANSIVATDAHFDSSALNDTQIAISDDEIAQMQQAASECYAQALEGVDASNITELNETQMETAARCINDSVYVYANHIANLDAADQDLATHVINAFDAAQTSYGEFADLIAVAASFDYLNGNQAIDSSSVRNNTLLFEMVRGLHEAVLAYTYQQSASEQPAATAEAAESPAPTN